MHKVAPAIEAATPLPLLHIADATGEEAEKLQVDTVGLLGTRFTMEEEFYRERLAHEHGLTVLIPGPEDRELVHRVIFNELCTGAVNEASRAEYRRIMGELVGQGAQAIVLGCTEISLLVTDGDAPVPLLDTTGIHARRAVEWGLAPK